MLCSRFRLMLRIKIAFLDQEFEVLQYLIDEGVALEDLHKVDNVNICLFRGRAEFRLEQREV